MKKLLGVCILLFLATACKTPKLEGAERLLQFGTGGGFTGKLSTLTLSSWGKVKSPSLSKENSLKISTKELTRIFALADSIKTNIPKFNQPGNLYYVLSFSTDTDMFDYTWGQTDFKTPEPILRLYNMLEKATKKSLKK